MIKKFEVKVGDKVAYSNKFLQSIGMQHSEMGRARGIVESIETIGDSLILATISWSNKDMPPKVNVQNLAKVGPNTRFCQC